MIKFRIWAQAISEKEADLEHPPLGIEFQVIG